MKNMSENKFYNLERKLNFKDYHLSRTIEIKGKKSVVTEWKLFRKFDDSEMYLSKHNKPILTSEKNSYKELKRYVNKHKRTDVGFVISEMSSIYLIVIWVLCFINIFVLKDQQIRKCVSAMMIGILIGQFIELIFSTITIERDLKEAQERFRHEMKLLYNIEETNEKVQ